MTRAAARRGHPRVPVPVAPARHLIVEATYQVAGVALPVERRRLLCSCGEVLSSLEWDAHRGTRASSGDAVRIHRRRRELAAAVLGDS